MPMTLRTLILRSLRFHARSHLGVLLGATLGSAILIGALLVAMVAHSGGFLVPKLALVSNILLMVAILMWRPRGLYAVTSR